MRSSNAGRRHGCITVKALEDLENSVELHYDAQQRKYGLLFRKTVRNGSTKSRSALPARIRVTAFPDDLELSRAYGIQHPLIFGELGFRAFTPDGKNLRHRIRRLDPCNIEIDLLLENQDTGHCFPLSSGATTTISYSFAVGDDKWGPYLSRHITHPTRNLSADLVFPKGLLEGVWIEENPGPEGADPLPVQRRAVNAEFEGWGWSIKNPDLESRFVLRWTFKDGRHKKLKEQFVRSLQAPHTSLHHSEDFRAVSWRDRVFRFSPTQAKVIKVLMSAARAGGGELHEDEIIGRVQSGASRLVDLFREHPAWRSLIIRGSSKGVFRLDLD